MNILNICYQPAFKSVTVENGYSRIGQETQIGNTVSIPSNAKGIITNAVIIKNNGNFPVCDPTFHSIINKAIAAMESKINEHFPNGTIFRKTTWDNVYYTKETISGDRVILIKNSIKDPDLRREILENISNGLNNYEKKGDNRKVFNTKVEEVHINNPRATLGRHGRLDIEVLGSKSSSLSLSG